MQFEDRSDEVEQFRNIIADIGYNAYSCHGLGLFYQDGLGRLKRSGEEATLWFTRCLKINNDSWFDSIESFNQINALTHKNAEDEARKRLPKECHDLQVDALIQLYLINQNTRTLDQIFDLMTSAKSGDARAQYELGDLFLNVYTKYFLPVSVRPRDGREWMIKAAEQGYTKAYLPLARYYRNADYPILDRAAVMDIEVALYWAEQAYNADPKTAKEELKIIRYLMD